MRVVHVVLFHSTGTYKYWRAQLRIRQICLVFLTFIPNSSILQLFLDFLVMLAGNFDSSESPPKVVFGCLRLLPGAPAASTHRIQSERYILNFAGCVCACLWADIVIWLSESEVSTNGQLKSVFFVGLILCLNTYRTEKKRPTLIPSSCPQIRWTSF